MLLFRPTFLAASPLSFSLNGQIPPYQAERSPAIFLHGPPFCVPRGIGLLFMKCWFLSHQFFSEPWATDGTYPPSYFVSMSMLPWAIPIPANVFLHILRIPGFYESQGILVQSLLGSPTNFSHKGWAELPFSFSFIF